MNVGNIKQARRKRTGIIWFHLHDVLRRGIFIKIEGGMMVAKRLERGENKESVFNGDRVSVWNDEKFLETDDGDGCITL